MNSELENVKVGDLVGPVHRRRLKWTGVLHSVEKVGPKRFMVHGDWSDKATGRPIGYSDYYYILATPEMIAEHKERADAATREKEAKDAFHGRADYQDASAISWALSNMKPDSHPLDKFTPAEWAEFRKRLGA